MKGKIYTKMQKEFGGEWVATSPKGAKVYAHAKTIEQLMYELDKKDIPTSKTTIGFVQEYKSTRIGPGVYLRTEKD